MRNIWPIAAGVALVISVFRQIFLQSAWLNLFLYNEEESMMNYPHDVFSINQSTIITTPVASANNNDNNNNNKVNQHLPIEEDNIHVSKVSAEITSKLSSTTLPVLVGRKNFTSRTKVGSIQRNPYTLDDEFYDNDGDEEESSSSSLLKSDEFAIINAASDNHFLENISMLRTLIKVNYTGPLFIYLMHLPNEKDSEQIKDFIRALKLSPLYNNTEAKTQVILYEVPDKDYYKTYCWKPGVIADALSKNKNLKVLMWSDSSTRYVDHPMIFANRVWEEKVDFAGRLEPMGMGENTHPDTYQYLNMSVDNYKQYNEIAATHFMMNTQRSTARNVLERWIDCGINHCRTCMAPDLITHPPGALRKKRGPPSDIYLAPRQDQAVLSLLLYEKIRNTTSTTVNIKIDWWPKTNKYINVTTRKERDRGVNGFSDLNQSEKKKLTADDKENLETFCSYCAWQGNQSCDKRKEYFISKYGITEIEAKLALVKENKQCRK